MSKLKLGLQMVAAVALLVAAALVTGAVKVQIAHHPTPEVHRASQ